MQNKTVLAFLDDVVMEYQIVKAMKAMKQGKATAVWF
jgi:hypothetical protein